MWHSHFIIEIFLNFILIFMLNFRQVIAICISPYILITNKHTRTILYTWSADSQNQLVVRC